MPPILREHILVNELITGDRIKIDNEGAERGAFSTKIF